jgi:AraC family transcriptional regulator, exoenzyme S synthesis regulatory protein ExsA
MMKVLPQSFFDNHSVQKLLVDGLSCIIYKEVVEATLQKEGYVSTHALTLVLQGQLKVENDFAGSAIVQANEMIFLPKGIYMVSDVLPGPHPFVALVFFFDEGLIDEFIQTLNHDTKSPKCTPNLIIPYTAPIRSYTETLLQLYKNTSNNHHKITRAKLFELLHLLSIGVRGEAFIHTLLRLKMKAKRNVKDFMLANFYKPLSVEDYAYLTGRSLSTFNRDFKRQFGVSPKKWLVDKRLERAHELLASNHSVSEVALEVGYEDFSHFIKVFHKKFGISPKQFHIQKRSEALV